MAAADRSKRERKQAGGRTKAELQLLADLDNVASAWVASPLDTPLVRDLDALRVQPDHCAAFHKFIEGVDTLWRALRRHDAQGDMCALLERVLQSSTRSRALLVKMHVAYDSKLKKSDAERLE